MTQLASIIRTILKWVLGELEHLINLWIYSLSYSKINLKYFTHVALIYVFNKYLVVKIYQAEGDNDSEGKITLVLMVL